VAVGAGLGRPTVRQRAHPRVQAHLYGHPVERLVGDTGGDDAQVVAQCRGEHMVALKGAGHERRDVAGEKINDRYHPTGMPEGDGTAGRRQQSEQRGEKAALAGPAGPDDGDALTGRNSQIGGVEDRRRARRRGQAERGGGQRRDLGRAATGPHRIRHRHRGRQHLADPAQTGPASAQGGEGGGKGAQGVEGHQTGGGQNAEHDR
jgi:hypothetical protein